MVGICFRPKESVRIGIVIDTAAGKSADWMVGVKKRRSVVGMLLQGLQMTPAIVKSAFTLNLVNLHGNIHLHHLYDTIWTTSAIMGSLNKTSGKSIIGSKIFFSFFLLFVCFGNSLSCGSVCCSSGL